MKFNKLKELSKKHKKQCFNLWNNEYPENLCFQTLAEFKNYLDNLTQQSHILMTDDNLKVLGWYFDFNRESEKWFVIILDSKIHQKGFGTEILNFIKKRESVLNGWVIDHNYDKKKDGNLYLSPIDFYLKNGFKKLDEYRLELDKISAVKVKWEK